MLQQQLKQKQRQLKSMEEELDAVKETVRDNKYELELIGAQIDKAERAYLARAKAAAAGAFTGQE